MKKVLAAIMNLLFMANNCVASELLDQTRIIQAGSIAKEMCSCLYITKGSNQYCKSIIINEYNSPPEEEPPHLLVDLHSRSVEVKIDGIRIKYQIENPRLGCKDVTFRG